MKENTKKLIVTIINIVIFVGNAIISFISNGGDVSTVAAIGVHYLPVQHLLKGVYWGALLTGTTLA